MQNHQMGCNYIFNKETFANETAKWQIKLVFFYVLSVDTRDEEYPYKVETNDRRYSDSDDDRSFNILPHRTSHSDELKGN